MTTDPTGGFATHSKACLARSVIAAVENLRDATKFEGNTEVRTTVEDFRSSLSTVLEVADGYLADGLMDCACHVASIAKVKETFETYGAFDATQQATQFLEAGYITPADYLYLVKWSEGRAR